MEYKVNTLSAHEAILLIQQLEVEKRENGRNKGRKIWVPHFSIGNISIGPAIYLRLNAFCNHLLAPFQN